MKTVNAQNIPQEARHCFISSEGCSFVGADYRNIEVRVLAYETGDESLKRIIEEDRDIHDENTFVLFGLKRGDDNFAIGREAAKTFEFGGIQYMGGDREIFEQITLKAPTLGLTFAGYQQAKQRWMAEHPQVEIWRSSVTADIQENKRVRSAFGRVRILMGSERDIYKEGLNFLIQSSAASIKNQSLIQMSEAGLKLILDIHDEIIVECHDEEVKKTKRIMKQIMEREINYRGQLVRFPVEIKSAKDWGGLK